MQTGDVLHPQHQAAVRTRTAGFAYVLLLIAIGVIGVVAAATLHMGSQIARRDAEQSLLTIGMEFQQALRSYAAVPVGATAPAIARGPQTLEELLKDSRVPFTRRYLRQIYADPLTGRDTWGLVKDPAGFILGIYSLADGKPIKQTGFELTQASFEESGGYATWVFGLPNAQLKNNNRSD
jgi:type II secretory pathway pseudopilin PulG